MKINKHTKIPFDEWKKEKRNWKCELVGNTILYNRGRELGCNRYYSYQILDYSSTADVFFIVCNDNRKYWCELKSDCIVEVFVEESSYLNDYYLPKINAAKFPTMPVEDKLERIKYDPKYIESIPFPLYDSDIPVCKEINDNVANVIQIIDMYLGERNADLDKLNGRYE